MTSIVTCGDNVVDCYEDRREMFPGGNCVNVAAFARRFGARSGYVGAVAADPAGRQIRAALSGPGVETTHLREAEGRTAYCVIRNVGGDRIFQAADLGCSIIEPDAVELDYMAGFDLIHTGRSSHLAHRVPDFAKRTRVSFDFADARDEALVGTVAPHLFLACLSGGGLSDADVAALQARLLGLGATWCLVTRGGRGASLAGPAGVTEISAERIEPVDTLGAGDTFIARTLVGLLSGETPDVLMHAAAVAAAETCLRYGGFGEPAAMEIDRSRDRSLTEIYEEYARVDVARAEGS